jgi:peroxiredoxin
VQLGKLQEILPELQALGIGIAAVSADDLDGAKIMIERTHVTFPILSDPTGVMLKSWSRWDFGNGVGLAGTFILGRDFAPVFFEDDGERFYKRPRIDRVLDVARTLAP